MAITFITGILTFLSDVTGDLGLAVVLLTLVIKLLFFPPRVKEARFRQVSLTVTEKVNLLRKKYRHNREQLLKEVAKVYQEHNYSPLSGIMPMIIQAPVLMGTIAF